MSLDVYLEGERVAAQCSCDKCGNEHQRVVTDSLFSRNITHNLNKMAAEAGIYDAMWRPEEIGVTRAVQMIPLLREGLARLRSDPSYFKQFNPKNGWGSYDGLVDFVEKYLDACERFPNASVSASR